MKEIICIKAAFLKLSTKKVIEINDIFNNNKTGLVKPRINITTKEPLRKQVIIPWAQITLRLFGNFANMYITNINRYLKEVLLDTIANFIWVESKDIIITTNKIVSVPDMSVIEKYLKENDNINLDYIASPYLLKYKSYLMILGLLYIVEKTNLSITSELIEEVIKEFYIFNDIVLILRSQFMKTSPKYDMAVVWVDIWDSQNGSKVKSIINQQFNVGWYIATIYSTNINSSIL